MRCFFAPRAIPDHAGQRRGIQRSLLLAVIAVGFSVPLQAVDETSQPPLQTADSPSPAVQSVPETAVHDDSVLESEAIAYHEAEVERLELEGDAFSPLLSESQFGLAKAYREQGKHQEALQHFRKSLHIDRVNNGLFNLTQEPIIREILNTHKALGDWEESRASLDAIHRINLETYGGADSRMIPVLVELADWHLNAYVDRKHKLMGHLVDSQRFSQHAIELIRRHRGDTDPQLVQQHKNMALSYYYLSIFISDEDNFNEAQGLYGTRESRLEELRAQELLLNGVYHKGRDSYQQAIHLLHDNPEASDVEKAAAYAELGDWFLLFGKRSSALKAYQGALSLVENEQEKQKLVKAVFEPLTLLPITPFDDGSARKPGESVVEVQMRISKYGQVENLSVLNVIEGPAIEEEETAEEQQDRLNRKTRRALRGIRFRPMLENDQFAARESARVKFRIEI